jgi:DNA-binding MarR family transcriptional regulator
LEVCHSYYPHVPKPLLPEEKATEEVLERWARAAEFRRRVNRMLKARGATLSHWRMLHAAERLVEETGDVVSQLDIVRRAGMDANTVSALTFRLGEKGWLSWGPDCYDFAYRIFVTDEGKALLAATRPVVLAVAAEIWGVGLHRGA